MAWFKITAVTWSAARGRIEEHDYKYYPGRASAKGWDMDEVVYWADRWAEDLYGDRDRGYDVEVEKIKSPPRPWLRNEMERCKWRIARAIKLCGACYKLANR